MSDDVEVVLAANNFAEVNFGGEDYFAVEHGSGKNLPIGLMMALPPRMITVSGASPCTPA